MTESPAPPGGRTKKTAVDMVLTLAVIIAAVGVIVLLVPRPNAVSQPDVDPVAAAASARPGLSFVPAVPAGLPAGWAARTAKAQVGTDDVAMWLLQYRTPAGAYGAVRQAREPDARLGGAAGHRRARGRHGADRHGRLGGAQPPGPGDHELGAARGRPDDGGDGNGVERRAGDPGEGPAGRFADPTLSGGDGNPLAVIMQFVNAVSCKNAVIMQFVNAARPVPRR